MATSTPAASTSEFEDQDVDSNDPVETVTPLPTDSVIRINKLELMKRVQERGPPALQAESAPGASFSSTGASVSPLLDTISPLHTRADSKHKDENFIHAVIKGTRTNSPILTIMKKNKTEIVPSIPRHLNEGKLPSLKCGSLWTEHILNLKKP